MYETALRHYHEGRLTEAAACCSTILNQTPREFRTLRLLGQVRSKQGALADAAYILTAALGIGSTDIADVIVALNELATVEAAQQHYDAAFDYYCRALAIEPNNADTLYNYGNARYAAGQIDAAIAIYREGLSKQPDYAEMHNNLGNALRGIGELEEAAGSYRRAIALSPDLVQAYNNLGSTLCLLDRADAAVDCHRRAIEINPDDAASLVGLGHALHRLKRYDEAAEQFQQALRHHPDDVTALFRLGITLIASNRNEEAAVRLERVVAISPSYGEARMALGNALIGLNRYTEALQQYRDAGATMPDSAELKHNEAIALLGVGAWPEGWQRLEARFAITSLFPKPPFPDGAPYWRGETDIAGKTILLQAEQGLGDTLQYVRYVPLVAERGARVVLRVQPELRKLLADMTGADTVVTLNDPPPDAALVCAMMSLPLAFGTQVSTVPCDVPYLRTPPEYLTLWQTFLGARSRPRIGVAWSGRQHLPLRSMPLAALAPLLGRPDFEFHALQQEIPQVDRDWLAANPLLIDHSAELKDFSDTAALVEQMDLVVTIDTAVAHLAGALARPVWMMLPFSADCRWLLNRQDTPWYPTARLFRQKRNGDWDGVVAEVVGSLL
jgi:tetratricopeptide (TPR) repeat protein